MMVPPVKVVAPAELPCRIPPVAMVTVLPAVIVAVQPVVEVPLVVLTRSELIVWVTQFEVVD